MDKREQALALAAEIRNLTEQAKRAPFVTIKPILTQLAEKQAHFNGLIAELI
ncbi:hypothetical protein LG288_05875 [Idiomarina seosinensis]|uniref:hypothetical protein n=1 Tax=Idiomarina seosinensis TaxID=281739 RepID=UPI003850035F